MRQLYDLSIIIVSYNAKDYLEKCLESVNQSLGNLNAELWVADNASTDRSLEMLQEKFPQVNLIANKENVGFSRANNMILQKCSAPFILLLNNDTVVSKDAIAKMITIMQQDKKIGALGPRLHFEDGSVQISYGPMISLWNEAWQKFLQRGARKRRGFIKKYLERRSNKKSYPYWVSFACILIRLLQGGPRKGKKFIKEYLERRSKKSCYPYWVSGACMLLRREALDQVGFFDENFFMYNEDVDLCHRLRQKGWKIFYTPEAEIIHLEGKSATNEAEKVMIEYRRSQLYFYCKYYGRRGLWLLKIYLLLKFTLLYLRAQFNQRNKKQKNLTLAKKLLKLTWSY